MNAPTRLLIVAADPLARASLAALLHAVQSVVVVGQAATDDDLRQAFAAFRPDVLLWDAGWEGAAPAETIAALSDDSPPILAIAAAGSAAALWAAGVSGLLGRTASAEAIAAAAVAAAAGLGVFDPAERARPPLSAAPSPGGAQTDLPIEPLTPRELDVLARMADGLSNKQIARALEISEHTVKYHINAILGKLGAQSRTDAVVRATRAGLLLL